MEYLHPPSFMLGMVAGFIVTGTIVALIFLLMGRERK